MKTKKKAKYIPPKIEVFPLGLDIMNIIITSAPKADPTKEMDSRRLDVTDEEKETYNFLWGDETADKFHE